MNISKKNELEELKIAKDEAHDTYVSTDYDPGDVTWCAYKIARDAYDDARNAYDKSFDIVKLKKARMKAYDIYCANTKLRTAAHELYNISPDDDGSNWNNYIAACNSSNTAWDNYITACNTFNSAWGTNNE